MSVIITYKTDEVYFTLAPMGWAEAEKMVSDLMSKYGIQAEDIAIKVEAK